MKNAFAVLLVIVVSFIIATLLVAIDVATSMPEGNTQQVLEEPMRMVPNLEFVVPENGPEIIAPEVETLGNFCDSPYRVKLEKYFGVASPRCNNH